jgi:hypothetical protein
MSDHKKDTLNNTGYGRVDTFLFKYMLSCFAATVAETGIDL